MSHRPRSPHHSAEAPQPGPSGDGASDPLDALVDEFKLHRVEPRRGVTEAPPPPPPPQPARRPFPAALAVVLLLVVGAGAGLVWSMNPSPPEPTAVAMSDRAAGDIEPRQPESRLAEPRLYVDLSHIDSMGGGESVREPAASEPDDRQTSDRTIEDPLPAPPPRASPRQETPRATPADVPATRPPATRPAPAPSPPPTRTAPAPATSPLPVPAATTPPRVGRTPPPSRPAARPAPPPVLSGPIWDAYYAARADARRQDLKDPDAAQAAFCSAAARALQSGNGQNLSVIRRDVAAIGC